MMDLDAARVSAIVRKELRDYRRKRAIVVTMAVLPVLFLIQPLVAIFVTSASESSSTLDKRLALSLLYLLLIPVITPATLAAYTVAGEREQGTLEPLLTSPLRRQEFILGKAMAIMIPSLVLSYVVFGLFLAVVALFAHPVVASAVFHDSPVLLALFLFAPLVAGWAIVVGMAVSVRASEVRVAQQLGTVASFPILGVVVLLAVGVIHPTIAVALEFALGLLTIDALALLLVSRMFDRERLVTGAKAARSQTIGRSRQPRGSPPRSLTPNRDDSDQQVSSGSPPAESIGAPATLILTREAIEVQRSPFEIVLDGMVIGTIARHQTVELQARPGRHSLRLRSGRQMSPDRPFDAAEGETINLRCHGARVWPIYLASLIKPDLGISLKQE